MKQKQKKNNAISNVTERDKKLLFLLGAVLVLAVSYFFVFSPNQDSADQLKADIKLAEDYVRELDAKLLKEAEKKEEIIQFNERRQEVLKKFPNGMTHEKAIEILAKLEDETDLFSSQVTLAVNNIFFNQEEARNDANVGIVVEDVRSTSPLADPNLVPEEEYSDLIAYKTTLTLSFTCTDEDLTNAMDFINMYEDKMSVESITVGYDETTGNLAGTMNLCLFSVTSSEKEYEAPQIDGVDIGISNIFGSKEVKSSKN